MQIHPTSGPPRSQPSRAREPRRPRVLIVEDDGSLAAGLSGGLVQEGYEVAHSVTGEAALGRMAGASFDLVLCDLMMPDFSGADLYREMQALAG